MILTWSERLDVERRLLAALFRWPRLVELEARHFHASDHGVLFEAIQELQQQFPVEQSHADEHGYSDVDLALVLWFIRQVVENATVTGRERSGWLVGDFVRWAEHYIINELLTQQVTPLAIPDLIEQVRECPRCGR